MSLRIQTVVLRELSLIFHKNHFQCAGKTLRQLNFLLLSENTSRLHETIELGKTSDTQNKAQPGPCPPDSLNLAVLTLVISGRRRSPPPPFKTAFVAAYVGSIGTGEKLGRKQGRFRGGHELSKTESQGEKS